MSLRGRVEAFPLEMVLRLLAATEKTGMLEVRGDGGERRGFLGVSAGRLVSAQYGDEDGYLALGAVFAIDAGDFEFLPSDRLDRDDLAGDLDQLLARAALERARTLEMREVIPSDRVRFRLSEQAAERGEVTLTPEHWRVLLRVDGERDVAAIAQMLSVRRLAAEQLLAGLVRAGLIETADPVARETAEEAAQGYHRLPQMQPMLPTNAGEPVVLRGQLRDFPLETVLQLLAETETTGRLVITAVRDSSTLGIAAGRLVSATCGEEEGELALGGAFTAQEGAFDLVSMTEIPVANLTWTTQQVSWQFSPTLPDRTAGPDELEPSGRLLPGRLSGLGALLDRAVAARDRIAAVRALIPDERSRFALSDRATRNAEIVLTPEQWRVLLGVNGERDVQGVADHLRVRRLPAMMVLADLVRGGYVDVLPPVDQVWPSVERRRAQPSAAEPQQAEVVEEPAPEPPPSPALEPPAPVSRWRVDEPAPAAETERPLAVPPPGPAPTVDERLAALSGLFGAAAPAPPATWEPPEPPAVQGTSAEAAAASEAAEAFAAALAPPAPEPVLEPEPEARPEVPAWDTSSWVTPAPEVPPAEPEPEAAAVDPRLAAFEPSALGSPSSEPSAEAQPFEPEEPVATEGSKAAAPSPWARRAPEPPPAPAPAATPEKKRGLFGGLFGGGSRPKPAAPAGRASAVAPPWVPRAETRPGQLGIFANELVAAYNSGKFGKTPIEHRMVSLLMRVDEQADPLDRPIPTAGDRIDVPSLDRDPPPDRQALPYLATLVGQIFDDAESANGRDKAKRGFREVQGRLFGKDLSLFHAPEVAGRMPKI